MFLIVLKKDIDTLIKGIKLASISYRNIYIHFFAITCVILSIAVFSAFIPVVLRNLINEISSDNLYTSKSNLIFILALVYGLMWTISEASDWFKGGITSYFLSKIESSIYVVFMSKILQTSTEEQDKISHGDFISQVERAGVSIGQLVYSIVWTVFPIIIQFIVAFLVIMRNVSFGFAIFINIFLILSFFISLRLVNSSAKIHPIIFSARNLLVSNAIDKLKFLFEIKTNNTRNREIENLNKVSEIFVSKIFKANILSAKLMIIQVCFIGLLLIISNLYLVNEIIHLRLKAGDFVMISGYIIQLSAPIIMLSQIFIQLKGDIIAINDIIPYLLLPEDGTGKNKFEIDLKQPIFSIKNMTVSNTKKIITTDIKSGYWYTIIGTSGSGKTSLIKNLLGISTTSHEKFLFYGINIQDLNYNDILSHISVVNQKPKFFKGSLIENLGYGIDNFDCQSNRLLNILNELNLQKFIPLLETESDFWMSQCSGGELQRLALVRSAMKHHNTIILDEPTSSLDKENTELVLKFLRKNFKSVIMITHNELSLKYSDYYMDMDDDEPIFVKTNTNKSIF